MFLILDYEGLAFRVLRGRGRGDEALERALVEHRDAVARFLRRRELGLELPTPPAAAPPTPVAHTAQAKPTSPPPPAPPAAAPTPVAPVPDGTVVNFPADAGGSRKPAARQAPDPASPSERCCAQCHGAPDGKERAITCEGKTVWLHPECQRFYFQGRARQPDQETPSPYKVLGPAGAGQRCIGCGSGIGAVKRIKFASEDGAVDLHVPCAEKRVAAWADPPVKIPDLGPDPLDEHGTPRPAARPSNGVEPGLSQSEIMELAAWYIGQFTDRSSDPDLAAAGALSKAVDGALRQRLGELGVPPEFIEVQFRRVMRVALAA
jgi:hypothetical protein